MNYNYNDNEEDVYNDDDDLLKSFELPSGLDEKMMVLQIMDAGGNIEDIIFDLEEIYKYVKHVYEKSPERN